MKKVMYFIAVCLLVSVSVAVYGKFKEEPEPVAPAPLTNAERMYNAIVLYADSFDIPLNVAFNIAYLETRYRGPSDSLYDHRKTSKCGALGAMQIMPQYASHYAGFKVTKQALRDSLELNVFISMKIMSENYKKTKCWKKAAGKYHTGKACIDTYAKKAVLPNYECRWVEKG